MADDSKPCPNCGKLIGSHLASCIYCGMQFRPRRECAKCGRGIADDRDACLFCGTPYVAPDLSAFKPVVPEVPFFPGGEAPLPLDVLSFHESAGWKPLLLPVFVIAAFIHGGDEFRADDTKFIFLTILVATALAVVTMLMSRGIDLIRSEDSIVSWWGLLKFRLSFRRRLSDYPKVLIEQREPTARRAGQYAVRLAGARGHITLELTFSRAQAEATAQQVARFLLVTAEDHVSRRPTSLGAAPAASTLGAAVATASDPPRQRLNADAAPASFHFPAAWLNWPLHAGTILFFMVLIAYGIVSAHASLQTEANFRLVLLGIVAGAIGLNFLCLKSETLTVTREELRVAIRGAFGTRTIIFPLDEIAAVTLRRRANRTASLNLIEISSARQRVAVGRGMNQRKLIATYLEILDELRSAGASPTLQVSLVEMSPPAAQEQSLAE